MFEKQNIRDYEVSIWTLQDSFITVLKPFGAESKGNIQDPQMTLKDDGENNFSFKIPMYLQTNRISTDEKPFKSENTWIENPIWYTTRNGNIIANMRKVKVIFNKKTSDEKVFEFIILKVTEEHEGYSKFCEVECEGLAFHELGKQGYNIELSEDIFLAEYEEWDENKGAAADKPVATIDYWIKKVLENTNWEYLVCMDWSFYDGIIVDNERYINDKTYRNSVDNSRTNLRSKQKVYRDAYISAWKVENDQLVAKEWVTDNTKLEKIAYVNGSNSNRYNLLQDIAESFQVFCKFIYDYDDTYHIIGRRVIFYNNFINETNDIIDFNYGYNTGKISREMDSNDLITKMYVSSLSDGGTQAGEIKISDALSNPMREDYLFNFDYLYEIGTISKDQYEEIENYKRKMKQIQDSLLEKQKQLNNAENSLDDWIIKRDNAKENETQFEITAARADDEYKGILEAGQKGYTKDNPRTFQRITNTSSSEKSYIIIDKGIGNISGQFLLYSERIGDPGPVIESSLITILTADKDKDTGLWTKVHFNTPSNNTSFVYGVFGFTPDSAAEKVKQIWANRAANEGKKRIAAEKEIKNIQSTIDSLEVELEDLRNEKQELINNFERFMGPALREGTWKPDDIYSQYQENKTFSLTASITNLLTGATDGEAIFEWDAELFSDEQTLEYYNSLSQTTPQYYPCVDLSNNLTTLFNLKDNLDKLNFVYEDVTFTSANTAAILKKRFLPINSNDGCKFGFINDGGIKPVLIILGIEKLLKETVNGQSYTPLNQIQNNARLSLVTYSEDSTTIVEEQKIKTLSWKIPTNKTSIIYPRFKIPADKFLLSTPENKIYFGEDFLQESEDYYVLSRDDYYYVTIKPESFFKHLDTGSNPKFSLHYSITTAAEAIYLDAIEIMKENSRPKVSYTIDPLPLDKKIVHSAYNRLGQLAHINDPSLKFENVMGYISELNLNLDKPWEDSYTIKNYKTKFEDLFSSIVAQTESMKSNSQVLSMAANLFENNGNINSEILGASLLNPNIEKLLKNKFATSSELAIVQSLADMASASAYKIINGEVGLAFPTTDHISQLTMNNEVGLLIEGTKTLSDNSTINAGFQVTNNAMGFYKVKNGDRVYTLYYDGDGNLALDGNIYARGGTIGSWVLGEENHKGFLYYNNDTSSTSTLNADFILTPAGAEYSSAVAGSANGLSWLMRARDKFGVTTSGVLYATGANISGKITATSGSIANFFISNTSNQKATSQNGGHRYTNSLYTYGFDTTYEYEVGMKADARGSNTSAGNLAFYVIRKPLANTWENAPTNMFYINHKGDLYAQNADITGKITAKTGSIGGWTINDGILYYSSATPGESSMILKPAGVTSSTSIGGSSGSKTWAFTVKNKFGVDTIGNLYATGATISGALTATSLSTGSKTAASASAAGTFIDSTGAIYVGSTNAFTVTAAGKVTATNADITGSIKAESGYFGKTGNNYSPWYIGTDGNALVSFIGNGQSLSTSTIGLAVNSSLVSTHQNVIWAGGTNSSAPFRVSETGQLTATGAVINGATTITGSTSINTSGSITMTGSSFTIQNGSTNPTSSLQINSEGIKINPKITNGELISGALLNESQFDFALSSLNCFGLNKNSSQNHFYISIDNNSSHSESNTSIHIWDNYILASSKRIIELDAPYLLLRGSSGGGLYQFAIRNSAPSELDSKFRNYTGILWIDRTGKASHSGWTECKVYYMEAALE